VSYFMVDVETDGPIPGDYSMIEIGVVMVIPGPNPPSFYGKLRPISNAWMPEALKVTGRTREETLLFNDPKVVMMALKVWLETHNTGRGIRFISDNNGFDAMFVSWYFWHFLGHNPFGHSSTNLGSLYKGLVKSMFKNFKHLRCTKHTHNPVDDALGNVEALLHLKEHEGLLIPLE
jgi:hypothetical protein